MGILSRIWESYVDEQRKIVIEGELAGDALNVDYLKKQAELTFREFFLPISVPAREVIQSIRHFVAK